MVNMCTLQMNLSTLLFVLTCGLSLYTVQGRTVTNLRQFRVRAVGTMFKVESEILKEELKKRNIDGTVTGQGIHLTSTGLADGEGCSDTNLIFAFVSIEDFTLQEELTDDSKETVATQYDHLQIGIPFTSKNQHGVLYIDQITDEPKRVFLPYSTNHRVMKKIDSIEGYGNGTIVLQIGTDNMVIQINHEDECLKSSDREVLDLMDDVTSKNVTTTDYPHPFDWGCDIPQLQSVSFCEKLKDLQCEVDEASPNVCAVATETSRSRRCPASIEILEIDDAFRALFPYLAPLSKSFTGEWLDRVHGQGITFPCLTDADY